jgi:DNA-binding PadR family transcriptional regulator
MSQEAFGDFPPRWFWAMAKGGGRGGPRRHHHHMDDLERMGAVRQFRGGPFGGPPFGPPFGGPRGRGRRRRGDVRVALLMLLAEEPRNGYQLMQEIEERSDGRWRPSPGSVYPTLSQLEDEGLIRSIDRDGQKLFEITDTGQERVAQAGGETAPWDSEDDPEEQPLAKLGPLVVQVGKATWQVAQAGDYEQIAKAIETLTETRRKLYRILAEDADD